MSGEDTDPFAGSLVRPGRSAPGASGRRKVHPLTPLVHGVRVVPILLIAVASTLGRNAAGADGHVVLLVLGGCVLFVVLVVALQFLAWTRLTYWFDGDGDLRVDSGVLTRRQRRLQLSRLQSVDVVSPMVARFVGMAEVRIEVAGSGDNKVALLYLTRPEADELRNEIVARSAGVRHDAGEASEDVLAWVPPGELFASLVLRGTTALLLVVTAALVVVTVMTAGPTGAVFLLFGGLPIFTIFTDFSRYYGFTVARSEDGLRLRHGLLSTASATVPPGRVQAVGIEQPLLWRRHGWVRVRLNVAGATGADPGSGEQRSTQSVLLPVAPWELALQVVRQVLPGVDLATVAMYAAPRRARARAFIQWGQLAVGWDDQVLVTRHGRLHRRWAVVPHARTQSVRVTQGPWQRSLDLASMVVDSTPGHVKIHALHQDSARARRFAQDQADRAAAARRLDSTVHWAADRQAGQTPDPLADSHLAQRGTAQEPH